MANPIQAQIVPTSDAKAQGVGPLAPLDSSDYDFSTTRYPSEGLATVDVPHYVVFNINLPTNSKYTSAGGGAVANVQTASQQNYNLSNSLGGKFQASFGQTAAAAGGAAVLGAVSGFSGSGGAVTGAATGAASAAIVTEAAGTIDLQPKLARIKKAIAIYMPETIVQEYNHDWQTASLTDALGTAGQAAVLGGTIYNTVTDVRSAGFVTGIKEGFNNAQGAEAIGAIAQAAGAGGDFTALALKAKNAAVNPMVEMVFKGTQNRHYQFVFDFQPRSSKEAAIIQDIIRTFRMYAAPEINTEANQTPGSSGRYFIPPAQFDISFYFMSEENKNIAKLSTCALTQIMVNYNQSGQFASFDDGHPVHINMTLSFIEMDIITRELIENFGY